MNTVQPIKSKEKLADIQAELQADSRPYWQRVYLLFMFGIYTGLRVSDLVRLTVGQVCGDEIVLIEQKTGKRQVVPIPAILKQVIRYRLAGMTDDEFIFQSRTSRPDGSAKPITTRSAENDMKNIAERFNIKTPFACHSMRKTFGYWHYQQNHDLEILREWFNHSNTAVTRRYICIDVEERRESVKGLNMGYTPTAEPNITPRQIKRGPAQPIEITRRERGKSYSKRATMAARQNKRKMK